MDIKALVENTMFDDAVALSRGHRAGLLKLVSVPHALFAFSFRFSRARKDFAYSKTVPSRFDMALDPLFNRLDVLATILEFFSHGHLVAVEDVGLGDPVGLRVVGAPASVLQSRAEVARQRVGLGGLEVHVVGAGGRVVGEERVVRLDLTGIGVHAAGRLSRFDVTPHHGSHVALVVHEARVKVGCRVGVGRLDVG